jgi:alkylation response protein AidB-like acyl-CoA dehydrogenase
MSAARPAPPPLDNDALGRARALVPILAAREPAATAARDVSAETIDDFRCAGILRLLQPRCFGGDQASVGIFLQIVDILAEGCASSAWVYGVLAELEWVIACLPEQGQIDIWGGNPEALSAGSITPRASGRRAQGGWRVSGRYPFVSGCRHATWAILGARCEDVAANEVPRYLFVPMHDLEIVDDWYTLGMRGTGSFSVVAHDVFVPEHRTLTIQDAMEGTPPGRLVHPDYPLLRAPRYFIVPFVLPAAAFGAARRALALAPASLRRSTRAPSDAQHLRLGEAAARIEAANLIFATRRAETVELMESGAPFPDSVVLRNRRDVALAFRMLRAGVEQLAAVCGASTIYDDSPLQSALRDITTIATHIVVSEEAGMVPYGRFMIAETMA